MQIVRQILGENDVVIGCSDCGEVESLFEGAQHHCGGQSGPFAATLFVGTVPAVGKLAIPASQE